MKKIAFCLALLGLATISFAGCSNDASKPITPSTTTPATDTPDADAPDTDLPATPATDPPAEPAR